MNPDRISPEDLAHSLALHLEKDRLAMVANHALLELKRAEAHLAVTEHKRVDAQIEAFHKELTARYHLGKGDSYDESGAITKEAVALTP